MASQTRFKKQKREEEKLAQVGILTYPTPKQKLKGIEGESKEENGNNEKSSSLSDSSDSSSNNESEQETVVVTLPDTKAKNQHSQKHRYCGA